MTEVALKASHSVFEYLYCTTEVVKGVEHDYCKGERIDV